MEVLELSDFIGSTSEIIEFVERAEENTFIICTEMGIFYELQQRNPEKRFYSVGHRQFCPNMKRVTLDKVELALRKMEPEVIVPEELCDRAGRALERMMELAQRREGAGEEERGGT